MCDVKRFIDSFDIVPDAVFLIEEGVASAMNARGRELCRGRSAEDILPEEVLENVEKPKTVSAQIDGEAVSISVMPWENAAAVCVRKEERELDIAEGFAGGIRSPAGNLSVAAELMREAAGYTGVEEIKQYTAMITRDALRVKRLADNIELLSSFLEERVKSEPVKTDVAFFIAELTDSVSVLAKERMIGVSFRGESGGVFADIDRRLFGNAFLQMVSNAMKFAGPCGYVSVSVKSAGERAILTVADNGSGFSERDLVCAFRAWTQEQRERTPERGAGFGLAIVSETARMHGGIAVAENTGSGAQVTVVIPQSKKGPGVGEDNAADTQNSMREILTQLSDALGYKNYIAKYLD